MDKTEKTEEEKIIALAELLQTQTDLKEDKRKRMLIIYLERYHDEVIPEVKRAYAGEIKNIIHNKKDSPVQTTIKPTEGEIMEYARGDKDQMPLLKEEKQQLEKNIESYDRFNNTAHHTSRMDYLIEIENIIRNKKDSPVQNAKKSSNTGRIPRLNTGRIPRKCYGIHPHCDICGKCHTNIRSHDRH